MRLLQVLSRGRYHEWKQDDMIYDNIMFFLIWYIDWVLEINWTRQVLLGRYDKWKNTIWYAIFQDKKHDMWYDMWYPDVLMPGRRSQAGNHGWESTNSKFFVYHILSYHMWYHIICPLALLFLIFIWYIIPGTYITWYIKFLDIDTDLY